MLHSSFLTHSQHNVTAFYEGLGSKKLAGTGGGLAGWVDDGGGWLLDDGGWFVNDGGWLLNDGG